MTLEERVAAIANAHAEWLVNHDAAIVASRREFDERIKILDERIAGLVSGFGEFMRRREAH
jgi:hypothetical protein